MVLIFESSEGPDRTKVEMRNEMEVYRKSKKTLPTRAEGQVRNKSREGRIEQGQLMELLDSGHMMKEFGPHLTGNGESLKYFEQVEQGKAVTC